MSENGTRPQVYTPEEVGAILKIGRTKVYQLVRSGRIRSVKIGKLRRVSQRALEEFLERQDAELEELAR